jgi:hypothetical protein
MDHAAGGNPAHVADGRSMQILHTGAIVHARRHRWRVVETRVYDDCQIVTLSGLGPANTGLERQLIVPFDVVQPSEPPQRLRVVRPGRWRRACRATFAPLPARTSICCRINSNRPSPSSAATAAVFFLPTMWGWGKPFRRVSS